ncbi:hypothetical protein DMA11_19480 [Marinilabiliaceae bacterium JC017]|nr:hypothetical protein DMA11_19480 [Marinilabiliaceae bacterium JC017]
MKMTKFFVSAMLMASVAFFTSCTEEVEDLLNPGPQITFKAVDGYKTGDATVKVNEEVKFSWEVKATSAKLASFTIRMDNADLDGFPKEKFGRDDYEDELTKIFDKAGEFTLVFIATDKDGKQTRKDVKITVEAVATPLAEAKAFEWKREGSKDATGLDVYGLSWTSNLKLDDDKYHAIIKKGADKLVVLKAEDWESITTKEALKAAVDEATGVDKWVDAFADRNGDYDTVLATQKEEAYFLIHIKKGTVEKGDNNISIVTITGESKE